MVLGLGSLEGLSPPLGVLSPENIWCVEWWGPRGLTVIIGVLHKPSLHGVHGAKFLLMVALAV